MKFVENTIETQIFNALMSRETTFKIGCIEFTEKLIVGTDKIRERKCRAKAIALTKLVEC